MKKIKVGDTLSIHCYKHNGVLYQTSSEATILEITDDCLICANHKTRITEEDGKQYRTREAAVMFFYKNRWFNIIGQLKKFGLFYYCNIATPFLIDDGIIKYIDYDLDLRVFPDGRYRILDKNEYNYHKKIMEYPKEIDLIIKREMNDLIEMAKNKQGPFEPGIIDKYYEIYRNLKK